MKNRIVILSTADFDSAIWTNKQHLAVGLARNYDVIYIESLGLRQPTFSASDSFRLLDKLFRTFSPRRRYNGRKNTLNIATTHGITLITPLVIPFHKYAVVRTINKHLLHRQIRKYAIDDENSTFWTFSPITYGLEELFGKMVYHSVDLLHTLPRVPGDVLRRSEIELLARADHVIASSRGVKSHLTSAGASEVLLWENVAHVESFMKTTGKPRSDLAVFAGNLTPSKLDLSCFQSVLDSGVELAIAGPIDIDGSGSSRQISNLLSDPRVTYYGNLSLSEMADLFATAKVGLIPYQINEYTQGVYPMKVFEYLASGLSIVSTALPSLMENQIPNLHLGDPSKFGLLVCNLLASYDEAQTSENIVSAQDHSWTSRIVQATELIESARN